MNQGLRALVSPVGLLRQSCLVIRQERHYKVALGVSAERLLAETEGLLEKEERDDGQVRAQFGTRWTRYASLRSSTSGPFGFQYSVVMSIVAKMLDQAHSGFPSIVLSGKHQLNFGMEQQSLCYFKRSIVPFNIVTDSNTTSLTN